MENFLDTVAEITRSWESPGHFFKWSAYASIAGVLRNNVYINYGVSRLYPNIYVMLLADSGHHRKGAGVVLAERFISKVGNTKLINGRSSIQGITDELCKSSTDAKGVIKTGGSAIFLAGELAAALVQDRSAIDILTDIYDYKEEYQVTLRGRDNIVAKDVVFSMLAASNIHMLDEMFSQTATYGGLLARTFVIVPNEQRPANTLIGEGEIRSYLDEKAITLLREISKLKGKMAFTDTAKLSYTKWYEDFRKSSFVKRDKVGVLGRLHTGILKVSIILTANKQSLEIGKDTIEQAIEECVELIPNYKQFIGKSGVSVDAKTAALLIEDLVANPLHKLTRREFISAHWEDVSVETVDSSVSKLEQAGFLNTLNASGVITYCLTELGKKEMEVK